MGPWSKLIAPSLVDFSEVGNVAAVLDVGSGTGALAFAVRDATKTTRVLGIDLSREYVDYAAAKSAVAKSAAAKSALRGMRRASTWPAKWSCPTRGALWPRGSV